MSIAMSEQNAMCVCVRACVHACADLQPASVHWSKDKMVCVHACVDLEAASVRSVYTTLYSHREIYIAI